MIDKVFDFSDTAVEDVMVPRPDIVALPVALTPQAAMEQVLAAPVHALPGLRARTSTTCSACCTCAGCSSRSRTAPPTSTDLRALLLSGAPRARDEAARPAADRDPAPEGPHGDRGRRVRLGRRPRHARGPARGDRRRDRRRVRSRGRADRAARAAIATGSRAVFPVEEFNERFERDLSDEDYHTVGGIVFGELGRAPAVGDSVEIGHVKFDVADGRRHPHPARGCDAAAAYPEHAHGRRR